MTTTTTAKLIARNVKPTHAHDCDRCVFLGTLDGCDLYYCPGDRSISYRHGAGSAINSLPLNIVRKHCKGDGSPYFALLARGARTPNAYETPDKRFAPKTCGECEDCDGEDVCDAERIALARAHADDYSTAYG